MLERTPPDYAPGAPNFKASARIDEEVKATSSSTAETAERLADSDSSNVAAVQIAEWGELCG